MAKVTRTATSAAKAPERMSVIIARPHQSCLASRLGDEDRFVVTPTGFEPVLPG